MSEIKNIPIGSDHAGYDLKTYVIQKLEEKGFTFDDVGTHSSERADYPDFGHSVAEKVENNKGLGIVICGSGNGINMTVNKHKGIRSALCWNEEITALARQHNDANIIAIPARFIDKDIAVKMIEIFFSTEFEGGRHANRVAKIPCS